MTARTGLRLSALFISMALVQQAQAALIVEYNFNNQDGVPSTVHPLVMNETAFTAGTGLNNPTFAGSNAGARGFGEDDAATAITEVDYWEFSFDAVSGWNWNLTSLTFDDSRDEKGPTDLQIRINDLVVANFNPQIDTTTNRNIDLTPFLALNGLTSATIRFIAFGDTSSGGTSDLFIDNVQLNGTAAPEPSALLLCGVLIPGALVYRRRRQSKTATEQQAA